MGAVFWSGRTVYCRVLVYEHRRFTESEDQLAERHTEGEVVRLPARHRRTPRRTGVPKIKAPPPTDDTIPSGVDGEGEPLYARTELDERFDALLEEYDDAQPSPEWILVADAFFAVTARENLSHADEAVEILGLLVQRAKKRAKHWLRMQLEGLDIQKEGASGDEPERFA